MQFSLWLALAGAGALISFLGTIALTPGKPRETWEDEIPTGGTPPIPTATGPVHAGAASADIAGLRIERLHIHADDVEAIRFSWWKDGNLMMRPLDLTEPQLLPLMSAAMREGVFTDDFLRGLQAALTEHFQP